MMLFGEFGCRKRLGSLGSFAYDGVLARCWGLGHYQSGLIVGCIITLSGDAIEYDDALCK